ncbi:hypothetical protein ABEU98_12525 [Priestia megaterium]
MKRSLHCFFLFQNDITQKALHPIDFCGNRLEAYTVLHGGGISETEFQAAIQSVKNEAHNRFYFFIVC